MIQFHEKPGLLLEPVHQSPSSFMVRVGCHSVKMQLNFTSDKESTEALLKFVQAYRTLFDEECIGPDGQPLTLYEIAGPPPNVVDQAPLEEPFVTIRASAPTSRWTRLLRWLRLK
jgi:hypothetical protein